MPNGESEKLVEAVAKRVREVLADADRRAEEIVADAEKRAADIVAEAESNAAKTVALSEDQARERIERARKALDELGVALGNPEPGSDPSPEETPEPAEPQGSDPSGSDEAQPEPDSPSTDDLIAQLKGGGSGKPSGGDGDAGARLVAMNLALEGASRDEVDQRLAEEFDLEDRDALLDEVFSRVKS